MFARHLDRIWLIAGAALIVVLVAAGWLLLIGPRYSDTASLRDQTASTRAQQVKLERELADLKEQNAQLADYRAALKKNQQALPADPGVPAFLRELQSSGDKAGVSISNLTVGTPVLATGSATVYQVAMTMTVDGDADQLGAFLVRLQNVQARAVVIDSANLAAQGDSGSALINLMFRAFVAPPAGSVKPTVTADATATTGG